MPSEPRDETPSAPDPASQPFDPYGPPQQQPLGQQPQQWGPPPQQPYPWGPQGQGAPPQQPQQWGQPQQGPPGWGLPGQPDQSTQPVNPVRLKGLRIGGMVAIAGAVIVGIGSVIPWVNTVFGTIYGTEGDGVISLVLAVIIVLVSVPLLFGKGRLPCLIAGAILGLLSAGVGGYHLFNLSGALAEQEYVVGSMGPGPSVIVVGALTVLISNIVTIMRT